MHIATTGSVSIKNVQLPLNIIVLQQNDEILFFRFMKKQGFLVKATVQIFPVENPWFYVPVPKEYTKLFADYMDRGLVPITVSLGKSTWNTSIMPKGDGTHFIPLSAKIRKLENIELGDTIALNFVPRNR